MFPPPEMRVPIAKPKHVHEQPSSSSAAVAADREAARDEHNYNVRAAWAYIYNDDLSPRDIGGPPCVHCGASCSYGEIFCCVVCATDFLSEDAT